MNLPPIKEFARRILEDDATGHDWQHALRVERNAELISPTALGTHERQLIQIAVWLHDTIDEKIDDEQRASLADIEELLSENGISPQDIAEIFDIIQNLSYSKNLDKKQELSRIGQIVQDADRLDALGAIGIARTFYYGGSQGHAIYDNQEPRALDELTQKNYRERQSVVNHFHEKLLHLTKTMNSDLATVEAEKRTKFMKEFLAQLAYEMGAD